MFSLETFLSVLLTSMFMTFPSSVFTLVLFDSLWKLQVEFIKCVLLWLHGDPSLPRILAGGLFIMFLFENKFETYFRVRVLTFKLTNM